MVHGSPPYGNETLQAPLEGLRPVIRPRSSSMKNACLLEDKTRKTACNVRSWLYVREESGATCQVPASPLPLVRCPINHSTLTIPPRGCALVASPPTTIARPRPATGCPAAQDREGDGLRPAGIGAGTRRRGD